MHLQIHVLQIFRQMAERLEFSVVCGSRGHYIAVEIEARLFLFACYLVINS